MMLLTKALRRRLPALYCTVHAKMDEKWICASFFAPDSSWTWLAVEGSPIFDDDHREVEYRFFGYIIGPCPEWGYWHLSELASARGPMGLPIERDRYFSPGKFRAVIKRYRHGSAA